MQMDIEFPGGAKVNALYKGMTIATDQPVFNGGDGSAPAPFDLFMASIGTCVGYYVQAFCRKRDIDPTKVKVSLIPEADPVKRMIGNIKIDITFPPDFPAKYEASVIRAAQLCAVKRHLENPPKFKIETHIG